MAILNEISEQLDAERESRVRREPGLRGLVRSLQIALVRRRIRKLVLLYDAIVTIDAGAMYPRDQRPNMFSFPRPRIHNRIPCRTFLGTVVISGREMLVIIDEARATALRSLEQKRGV